MVELAVVSVQVRERRSLFSFLQSDLVKVHHGFLDSSGEYPLCLEGLPASLQQLVAPYPEMSRVIGVFQDAYGAFLYKQEAPFFQQFADDRFDPNAVRVFVEKPKWLSLLEEFLGEKKYRPSCGFQKGEGIQPGQIASLERADRVVLQSQGFSDTRLLRIELYVL